MNISVEGLRLFNKCPLLYEQSAFYRQKSSVSRMIFSELESVFNNVFYQLMRGRKIHNQRIESYWKEAMKRVMKSHKNIEREAFEFPAQCLAIFMDTFEEESSDRRDVSFEIKGPGVPFEVPISPGTIVTDQFHLVTSGRFGTKITLFEFLPFAQPEIRYVNDFFYTIYSHAFRREFGKNELCVRIRNLGDGKVFELLRDNKTMEEHLESLNKIGSMVSSGIRVPALSLCSSCPISSECHTRMYANRT